MSATLALFTSPGTCALASHIALEDAGLAFEPRRLRFAEGEQRAPDYLRINPKGRVPALATPQGILTETPAILVYIAQIAPDARLAPFADAFAFARAQSFAAYLCATVHVAHAHRPRGSRWATEAASLEDMKRKTPENMAACFELIETSLYVGPWAMGEAYSFVDPYLFTVAGWLGGDGVDIARFPRVHDHFRRMTQRPSVIRALEWERSA